jgi:hypothetical protein
MPNDWITKGTRVHVRFFNPKEPGTWSLAGEQKKLNGIFMDFLGTVRHVRADHPDTPQDIRLWVEPDDAPEWIDPCPKCGAREIGMIRVEHVTVVQ